VLALWLTTCSAKSPNPGGRLPRASELADQTDRRRQRPDPLLTSDEFWKVIYAQEMVVWLREAETVILDDPIFLADVFE
jgi:hypothetical protein